MKNFIGTLSLISVAFVAGCNDSSQIEEHIVPPLAPAISESDKSSKIPPPASKVSAEAKETRMLASIFPLDEQGYFFKMEGAPEAVNEEASNFESLMKSLIFEQGELAWKLPEGWKNLPASGMRLATLVLPAKDGAKPLEVSVLKLPMRGGTDQATLENINRWRGQLGLDAIAKSDLLSKDSEKTGISRVKSEEGEVVIVNLLGKKNPSSGMTPPFAR